MKTREEAICEKHGYTEPEQMKFGTITGYKMCQTCLSEIEKKEREDKAKAEEAERIRAASRAISELAIGSRYKGITFDEYEEVNDRAARIKLFCKRYTETFTDRLKEGDSILMLGACGTGKNMLAAIICQEVIRQGYSAVHTSVVKMIRRVKESWRKDTDETESKAIKFFSEPSLLVVDEVGVQFGSETERMYLTEIINDRYEARKPTILISNLSLAELEGVVGQRVVDRFYEGKGGVLVFDWSSYRRKGKG